MSLLAVSNLSKYRDGNPSVHAIGFNQERGENIAIVGETGSGKTSLLKMIAGLLQPDEGEILLNRAPVLGPLYQLIPGHKDIGYLSQHFELLNHYKVYEVLDMHRKCSEQAANDLYQICRIEHLLQRRTDALSGGERQRIALAQQLVKSPQLILLDEPFSNLDFPHRQMIKQVLKDLRAQQDKSFIWVSHDAADVLSWADTMYIMQQGTFLQQGTPVQLYHHPINAYAACLLCDFNSIIVSNGRTAMIRPEKIVISSAPDNEANATIQSIDFCGDHFLIGLHAHGKMLRVKTIHANWSVGASVHVGWHEEDLHYFQ